MLKSSVGILFYSLLIFLYGVTETTAHDEKNKEFSRKLKVNLDDLMRILLQKNDKASIYKENEQKLKEPYVNSQSLHVSSDHYIPSAKFESSEEQPFFFKSIDQNLNMTHENRTPAFFKPSADAKGEIQDFKKSKLLEMGVTETTALDEKNKEISRKCMKIKNIDDLMRILLQKNKASIYQEHEQKLKEPYVDYQSLHVSSDHYIPLAKFVSSEEQPCFIQSIDQNLNMTHENRTPAFLKPSADAKGEIQDFQKSKLLEMGTNQVISAIDVIKNFMNNNAKYKSEMKNFKDSLKNDLNLIKTISKNLFLGESYVHLLNTIEGAEKTVTSNYFEGKMNSAPGPTERYTTENGSVQVLVGKWDLEKGESSNKMPSRVTPSKANYSYDPINLDHVIMKLPTMSTTCSTEWGHDTDYFTCENKQRSTTRQYEDHTKHELGLNNTIDACMDFFKVLETFSITTERNEMPKTRTLSSRLNHEIFISENNTEEPILNGPTMRSNELTVHLLRTLISFIDTNFLKRNELSSTHSCPSTIECSNTVSPTKSKAHMELVKVFDTKSLSAENFGNMAHSTNEPTTLSSKKVSPVMPTEENHFDRVVPRFKVTEVCQSQATVRPLTTAQLKPSLGSFESVTHFSRTFNQLKSQQIMIKKFLNPTASIVQINRATTQVLDSTTRSTVKTQIDKNKFDKVSLKPLRVFFEISSPAGKSTDPKFEQDHGSLISHYTKSSKEISNTVRYFPCLTKYTGKVISTETVTELIDKMTIESNESSTTVKEVSNCTTTVPSSSTQTCEFPNEKTVSTEVSNCTTTVPSSSTQTCEFPNEKTVSNENLLSSTSSNDLTISSTYNHVKSTTFPSTTVALNELEPFSFGEHPTTTTSNKATNNTSPFSTISCSKQSSDSESDFISPPPVKSVNIYFTERPRTKLNKNKVSSKDTLSTQQMIPKLDQPLNTEPAQSDYKWILSLENNIMPSKRISEHPKTISNDALRSLEPSRSTLKIFEPFQISGSTSTPEKVSIDANITSTSETKMLTENVDYDTSLETIHSTMKTVFQEDGETTFEVMKELNIPTEETPVAEPNVLELPNAVPPFSFDFYGLKHYNSSITVRQFVADISEKAAAINNKNMIAQWNHETNMTHKNYKIAMVSSLELIHYQRIQNQFLDSLRNSQIYDPMLEREIKLLYLPGMSILPDIKIAVFEEMLFAMDSIYSSASVISWNNPHVRYHLKEVKNAMSVSKIPEELCYYWTEWRNVTGRKLRRLYDQYVELLNVTAISNGFCDASEMWTKDYETEDFMQLMGCHWEEIRPLYLELHAYVRFKLHKHYGDVAMTSDYSLPIPAHLVGDLWGQSWKSLFNITRPYEKVFDYPTMDIRSKGYTTTKMALYAEAFFSSLGFPSLPHTFWKNSILTKQKTHMSCEPTAWDMCNGKDFRIKMCSDGTLKDFFDIHHQLTHVEYFIQYKDLSSPFRRGPNPGRFHEALAGTVLLSVGNPYHLSQVGLAPKSKSSSTDVDINYLLRVALDKVAFLPYSYIVDLWRYKVFKGDIKANDYNKRWWELRLQYQGLAPPNHRTEDDFDPGCKLHISGNKPYIQNFLSTILQFQFHEALCRRAELINKKTPLHNCDISNSREAGAIIRRVMSMGATQHWRVAMNELTGTRQISSKGLVEFFKPLLAWLRKENMRNRQKIGWRNTIY